MMLFDNLPRTPPKKLMQIIEASYTDDTYVVMECNHCKYNTGWQHRHETVTQLKRGIPCPKCNGGNDAAN